MYRSLGSLCFVSTVLFVLAGCGAPRTHFGEPMIRAKKKPLTVGTVMADPDKYEGQAIRVRGTVAGICKHSGCKMKLAHNAEDKGEGLLVVFTFDRTKYRVPPEAVGKEALVEGTLKVEDVSEAQRREFAKRRGMPDEELAKISGSKKSIRLECPSATIYGVEPGTPVPCEHEDER